MPIVDIYRVAIANLESEASNAYQNAYTNKLAEFQNELNAYTEDCNRKLNEKIEELRNSCQDAIRAKKAEIDSQAKIYASVEKQKYDYEIEELKKKIGA